MALVRNTAFAYLERYVAVACQIAGSIVIARLLTPSEIGVISISIAVVGFAHLLRDVGVSGYIYSAARLEPDDLRACLGISMLLGGTFFGILYLGAGQIGAFFDSDGVTRSVRFLAFNFLIAPLSAVPTALAVRLSMFGRIAVIGIVYHLVFLFTSVGFAYQGFSYMSIPFAAVLGTAVVATLFALWRSQQMLWRPSLRGVVRVFSESKWVFGSTFLAFASERTPEFALGRLSSLADAAYFEKAGSSVDLARRLLIESLTTVLLPKMRSVNADETQFRRFASESAALMITASATIAVGVYICAEPLLLLLFGPQWYTAVAVLHVLALGTPAILFRSFLNAMMLADQRYRALTGIALWHLVASIGLLVAVASRGPIVASWVVAGVAWISTLAGIWACRARWDYQVLRGGVGWAATAVLATGLPSFLAVHVVASDASPWQQLLLAGLAAGGGAILFSRTPCGRAVLGSMQALRRG